MMQWPPQVLKMKGHLSYPGDLSCVREKHIRKQNNWSESVTLYQSTAGRKAVTRKWLKPEIPTIDDWIDIIYGVFGWKE